MKRTGYHTQSSRQAVEKLRLLQLELPSVCTEYFRAISQITSALTRQAYAYDLRLFFQYLCAEEADFLTRSQGFSPWSICGASTPGFIIGFRDYLPIASKTMMTTKRTDNHHQPELGIMRG